MKITSVSFYSDKINYAGSTGTFRTPSFGNRSVERKVNPDRILLFLEKSGISRMDFARALDLNHLIMNKIIVGQRKLPESVITDFAKRIGLSADWFIKEIKGNEPFLDINTAELKRIIAETKHAKTKPVKERPVKTKPLSTVVIQDAKSIAIFKSAMTDYNIDEKTLTLALGCGKKCLQEKLTGQTEIFAQDIFVLSRLCKTNIFDKFNIEGLSASAREDEILSSRNTISAEVSKSRLNRNIKLLISENNVSIKTVADATGVAYSRLNSMVYTNGKCYVKDLFALAKYFNNPPIELFV